MKPSVISPPMSLSWAQFRTQDYSACLTPLVLLGNELLDRLLECHITSYTAGYIEAFAENTWDSNSSDELYTSAH